MPDLRILTPVLTTLGENPIWDVETERLYWLDVFGRTIFRCTADGAELTVWRTPQLNALALRANGGAVGIAGQKIVLFDFDSGESEVIFENESGFNDCAIDRQGRFVTGAVTPGASNPAESFDKDAGPRSGLFMIDADLHVRKFGDGVAVSNGPTFSPDGMTLYWSDSGTRQCYAWDYDPKTGSASNRRRHGDFFADTLTDSIVVPDGATIDAEGCRWVACFFGQELRRYTPDGELDRRLPLPVNSPTSVAFGGSDLDILFVTSMAMDDFPRNPHRPGPVDGTLLAVHGLGVAGVPELRFAG